jgi:hypothetical protein
MHLGVAALVRGAVSDGEQAAVVRMPRSERVVGVVSGLWTTDGDGGYGKPCRALTEPVET